MKKLLPSIVFMFCAIGAATAAVDTVETLASVKATVTNATTPWFAVPTDNIGVGISVTNGSCTVEIALEPHTVCLTGASAAFEVDFSPATVMSGQKKFTSINGASCVRAVCSNGAAILLIRRH